MSRRGSVAVLALCLLAGGCSRYAAPSGEYASLAPPVAADFEEAVPFEPEADPGDMAGGRGVDPMRALRSAEAAQSRWRRQRPIDYSRLPVHPGEALLRGRAAAPRFASVAPEARPATWGEDAPAAAPLAGAPGRIEGKSYDGDAAFRRIEAGGRRSMGSICSGC